MMEWIEQFMKPQLMAMVLAAVGTFITVLTVALPAMQRDRTSQRMKVMATERDKMRASRLAELSKDGGGSRLRQAPKGFMQQIVDQLPHALAECRPAIHVQASHDLGPWHERQRRGRAVLRGQS